MPNREACCTHLKDDVEPESRDASHTDLQEDEEPRRRVLSQSYQKEEGNVVVGGACCMDLDVEPGSRGACHTDLRCFGQTRNLSYGVGEGRGAREPTTRI